ncbi:MAG TPA: regulatory protein RecX [Patescibacteria group bacterium]|nr:regulatory protein RecX [Patescibacteria group bacterium]
MEDKLYLLVLKFLSFRPRSEKEVRDYLKKKQQKFLDINSSSIDLLIYTLKQQKFLNDRDFAKMWIRSRTEYKPKGERLIRMELQQKGISKDLINEAFEEYKKEQEDSQSEGRDEFLLAKGLLERKRRKYEHLEDRERFSKAGSMLARRGFDLDTIKAAIDSCFGKMV